MASNPNRPEYQDTIESTWGQSVADHVIRRYATTAERDADLAGLTPADLEGQVVAITGPGGATYLEQYRGGAWVLMGGGVGRMQGLQTGGLPPATNVTVNMAPDPAIMRGGFAANGNGLVVPVAGIYQVSFQAKFTNTSGGVVPAGYYYAYLSVAGGGVRAALHGSPGGATPTVGLSDSIALNAGDLLTLVVNVGPGGVLVAAGGDGTYLTARN